MRKFLFFFSCLFFFVSCECIVNPENLKSEEKVSFDGVFESENFSVDFDFQKQIQVESAEMLLIGDSDSENSENVAEECECKKINENAVCVSLKGDGKFGRVYAAKLSVSDNDGKMIDSEKRFVVKNRRAPKLIFTELRTESNTSRDKYEFVEFEAKSAGNLEGVSVYFARSVQKSDEKAAFRYVFPSCEVENGEIIVLHLRDGGEGCVNECDDDLDASTGKESVEKVRDFWLLNETGKKMSKNSVVILEKEPNGEVLDAVAMVESADENLSNVYLSAFERACESGAWVGGAFSFNTDSLAYSVSVARKEDDLPSRAPQWFYGEKATMGAR